MKKTLVLALVFVMVLGLAAPAMAYTTRVSLASGVSPYVVDIYLVEYTSADNLTVNWLSMPPTDRGYAKNEVVAAIGTLTIPNDYGVHEDGYRQIYFKGANVSLRVYDNQNTFLGITGYFLDYTKVSSYPNFYGRNNANALYPWEINDDGDKLSHWLASGSAAPVLGMSNTASAGVVGDSALARKTTGAETMKFLCFGKVTADDATLTFGLSRNAAWVGDSGVTTPSAAVLETDGHWGIDPFNAAAATWLSAYAAANTAVTGNARLPINTGILTNVGPITRLLILGEDLLVGRVTGNANDYYFVFDNPEGYDYPQAPPASLRDGVPGNLLFVITTGNRGVTERLYMFPDGADGVGYHVFVEPSTNELVFAVTDLGQKTPTNKVVGDDIRIGSTAYGSLRSFYDANFEGKLGFTAYNRGNILIGSDWTDLAAAAWDIKETVDIEPWTPYVSVPDNIVTDPPKTGEYSILGFVMIALAGAAAVVVKRVRA